MAQQTFAQYLVNKILPDNVKVTKPINKGYLETILTEVSQKAPDQYPEVVTELKALGDKLSTWESISFGLDELSVPNKSGRDRIVAKYQKLTQNEKDPKKLNKYLSSLQKDLAQNDLSGDIIDDATLMVNSALGGKKTQLMKLRTSPGVVGSHDGKVVNEIFNKSYAEGVSPLHFWLGAAESRRNLAQGQVATSAPGELSKVISNTLNGAVVSTEDCGTRRGIELYIKDENIIGRTIAKSLLGYSRGTVITPSIQQELLHKKGSKIWVRSPQTCEAKDGTVCAKCMGLRPGTGRPYQIGDNVGMIAAGSLAEPLTQMALSAKHSTSMAEEDTGLKGEKGFRMFVEMPEKFTNRKVLCEVYGEIYRIRRAPQGGNLITIRQTQEVPKRYIIHGLKNKDLRKHWDYYIAPNLSLADGIEKGTKVYPGMELSTGIDNVADIARLRNLGAARSVAAEGMYNVYKNTGKNLARTHFELLARNAHPYVKIEKAPSSFGLKRGEVVEYNALEGALGNMGRKPIVLADSLGKTLTQGILDVTAGTVITDQIISRLKSAGIREVHCTDRVEVSPATTPLTRVVNKSNNWISAMNHRYLKEQVKDAASFGKGEDIHGYRPISAYSYGVEMGQGEDGRY